ncbi:MAG: gamma-glutamyltransferase family protein [Proteobacteria bacterium]|nr:gamma-glutamyltransferase family protein [Pseudomonadota bacterium]
MHAAAFVALLLAAAPAWPQSQAQPEAPSGWQSRDAVHAKRFMVVAANPFAVEAGVEVLRAGGGALDAAIAVQMVLGLVEPQSSGLGGGAFLLYWSQRERRLRSYDGRETTPAAAKPDRFLGADGRPQGFVDAVVSGRSVGVPGVLRMLELAHRRHGRLAWARLFEPAIQLAEQGFPMSPRLHRLLEGERELRKGAAARALYYGADDRPRAVGTRIVNLDYAATLRAIAVFGADAFYTGTIAQDIVRAVRGHARPGDLDAEDLAGYRALERDPVCLTYRAMRVCSMGPPGGGAAVLQLLGILERTDFRGAAPNSAAALHYFSEAGRLAYADRGRYHADPDFVAVPLVGLLAPDYLDRRARLVGERSLGRAEAGQPEGAQATVDVPETTLAGTSHLSIVDGRGDAISMTTTIESAFGSRILVRGFLLNNQLTDFSFATGAANGIAGGKRPRSAMSPTMVLGADGAPQVVLGSPGGPAIINYVARTLAAMIDWRLDAQGAVSLPHGGSMNGPTQLERGTGYEQLATELRARGHEVRLGDLTSGLHVIERVPGGWRGGADPRREGIARGD